MTDGCVKIFSLEGIEGWAKVVDLFNADSIRLVFHYNGEVVKMNCRLANVKGPDLRPRLHIKGREEQVMKAITARNILAQLCSNQHVLETFQYNRHQIRQLMAESMKTVWFQARRFDKYGRLLVVLYDDASKESNINTTLTRMAKLDSR